MNRQERIAAAKERLRQAEAAKLNHGQKRAAVEAAGAKAESLLARLRKRGAIVFKQTGDAPPQAGTIVGFGIGYGTGTERTEKAVRKALEDGALKVSLPGQSGVSVAPSTAVGRTRFLTPAWVKRIAAAQRALDRASERKRAAEAFLAAEAKAAFDDLPKPEPKVLWTQIAQVVAAEHARPYRGGGLDNDRWEDERDEHAVAEAQMHLAAAKSGSTCECEDCKRSRFREAEAQRESERIATLPVRTVKCATHGRKRAHWETRNVHTSHVRGFEWPDRLNGRWLDMPVAYCPGTGKDRHEIVFASEVVAAWQKTEQVRLREEAKAAKARARKVKRVAIAGEPAVGDMLTFRCANCATVNDGAAVYDPGEDEEGGPLPPMVDCEGCGAELIANAVQQVESARKAA